MKINYRDGFTGNQRAAKLPACLDTSLAWLICAAALLWAGLGILGF